VSSPLESDIPVIHVRDHHADHLCSMPEDRCLVYAVTDDVDWAFVDDPNDVALRFPALNVGIDFTERRITAHGEIVLGTLATFFDLVVLLIESSPGNTTIDLVDVHRIDGAGYGCLVEVHRRLVARGAELIVAAPQSHRDRLFDIANLLDIPAAKLSTASVLPVPA
jgi:anti-anti-sigma factor